MGGGVYVRVDGWTTCNAWGQWRGGVKGVKEGEKKNFFNNNNNNNKNTNNNKDTFYKLD